VRKGFIAYLTHEAGPVWGSWCLVGIVSASVSTASGAILAMGTVFSHNIMRHLEVYIPNIVTERNLVLTARLSMIPLVMISTIIAAYYKSGGATGYLLTVAFDVVLATAVAPIFGAFYTKKPSSRAALGSILLGAMTRIILEFSLPKDGSLIYPREEPEFQNYGPAASAKYPVFFDKPDTELWNPLEEPCKSHRYEDYTGVDSLTAFGVSVITFCVIQWLEHRLDRPLFTFPGMQGYDKEKIYIDGRSQTTQQPDDN
jgi:Na+/proline symporter